MCNKYPEQHRGTLQETVIQLSGWASSCVKGQLQAAEVTLTWLVHVSMDQLDVGLPRMALAGTTETIGLYGPCVFSSSRQAQLCPSQGDDRRQKQSKPRVKTPLKSLFLSCPLTSHYP